MIDPACKKCRGTGEIALDRNPYIRAYQPCDNCCDHEEGFDVIANYGDTLYCMAGCGSYLRKIVSDTTNAK